MSPAVIFVTDEVLGVKPANLKIIRMPDEEDKTEELDAKFARLKRKFDRIREKYHLNDERVSGEIADLLTGKHGGNYITADEFATRYGMTPTDAKHFLEFIHMAMEFKARMMDPHNNVAAQASEQSK
mmetsp:Transcript_22688/g.61746  ORF Transcript_22688/g.61746 Transcript_22688/m.61746 type:complete len:127 (+) Transcript_22688:149-529(+)